MRRLFHPLDRYLFREFARIFVGTALGFPVLVIVIDLTDHLDNYLNQHVPPLNIALSYVYWVPESMFMALPAALLFAAVFTIGAATRHSEITAAKASGISFHRFIRSLYVGAIGATMLGLVLGELVPIANIRRAELLEQGVAHAADTRQRFAYAAQYGRVYKINALRVDSGTINGIQIERRGNGPDYPTYVLAAQRAVYNDSIRQWTLNDATLHILPDSFTDVAFHFEKVLDRQMIERPADMTARSKAPEEMRYQELGTFIYNMERSGADVRTLRVERMLKLAVPATCFIILLFGAPLATSTRRGGAAYGIGVSLATTVIFLMLVQFTKAIGGSGMVQPELAAWIPSILFGSVGLVMLWRVRT